MKEQKLYVCDYCGTQYKEKVRCTECENSHVGINKIEKASYYTNGKYPDYIKVVFTDGRTNFYKKI